MMRIIGVNVLLYVILVITACDQKKSALNAEQAPTDPKQETIDSTQEPADSGKEPAGLTIENLGEIRQAPDFSKMQNFIENSSFDSVKRPNIYFIFFDTLRPDIALREGKNFKKFYDQNFSFMNAYAGGTATVYSTSHYRTKISGGVMNSILNTNLSNM